MHHSNKVIFQEQLAKVKAVNAESKNMPGDKKEACDFSR